MGEVYKAHDERLDRNVAVKVLKEELASDPERLRRFEQEARAASALDHPNIITIHDIAESDGVHFIVMQFVEGKTLRELLKQGPLPTEKLFSAAWKPTSSGRGQRAFGSALTNPPASPILALFRNVERGDADEPFPQVNTCDMVLRVSHRMGSEISLPDTDGASRKGGS